MWRFSSCFLPAHYSIKRSVLPCLLFLFAALSPANAQVQKIYAGAVQSTPDPIVACTTSGFAVDATLLTAKPNNDQIEFHRIDRSRTSDRIGYFITRDNATSTRRQLYTYDARTMSLIKTLEIQALGQTTFNNQITGEVIDGILYLFRRVGNAALGCPVGQGCLYLTKYDRQGLELGSTLVSGLTGITENLDDVRRNGSSTLLLTHSNTAANRFLTTWSVPGGSFVAVSAALGPLASSQLAINADAGFQYIGFHDAARTVKRIQLDSVTVDTTNAFSFSGSETLGAIAALPELSRVIGGSTSFGGLAAVRNYRDLALNNVSTTTTYLLSDGSAAQRATFWDAVNLRTYEFRVDAGSGAFNLMRTTPDTTAVQERFNCTGCGASSLPTTDFAVSNARLYNAFNSTATVAGVVRVKVCATGGPPA